MTAPRLVPYSQRWHLAKIIIRVLIVCFIGTIWGLFVTSSIGTPLMGPVIISDLVWTFAEFITLAIRRAKKRGIHPIAHLIFDILFWLAYFVGAIWYGCGIANARGPDEFHRRNYIAEGFIMVFVVVVLLLHFVLFVRGCFEVHQRRVAKGPPKAIYYTPGQGAPFTIGSEPQDAEMHSMPAATRGSESVSSLPEKDELRTAESHAQLGADHV
ncbi:hypothetical protein Daus18300_014008 [Diaporthe australafricana]|uniref:MARVEL domain-containing protein n=1 Tax=Diaporthe australafricana TaxID=127596 RepID=A0ABR3VWX2_9PEZI